MHHLLKCLQQNELLAQAEGIKLLFENEVSKITVGAHFLEAGVFFFLYLSSARYLSLVSENIFALVH